MELTDKQVRMRQKILRRVRTARWKKEMSQEALAEAIGTSRTNISRIESGNKNVSLDQVVRMADAMGYNVDLVMEEPAVYGDPDTEYSVRLYDEELFSFRFEGTLTKAPRFTHINEELKDLFPLGLELTDEGLGDWISRRSIPKNREFVGAILSTLGLDINQTQGIIDVCKGLSLNDSYWIVPKGSPLRFADYDLYENEFSELLSLVAFTGYGRSRSEISTSPELTTGGMLRKGWRFFEKDGVWLYKGGSVDFANAGNEPYSEFYAYQVAEKMGLNAVPYELVRWKGILASRCRLFTDIDTSYVPIGQIVKTGGIEAVIEYYKGLGGDAYQQLASMLVFDAVVLNEDRHYGNFGLLRDNRTGRIIGPAPIFDNGNSLLCYAMKKDFDDGIDGYVKTRRNPYGKGNSFEELCAKVMGPPQRAQLRKILDFRFTPSDIADLPSWRLKALEKLIRERASRLLDM
jgi:transcriptional regulator with XRE-family HTH domain